MLYNKNYVLSSQIFLHLNQVPPTLLEHATEEGGQEFDDKAKEMNGGIHSHSPPPPKLSAATNLNRRTYLYYYISHAAIIISATHYTLSFVRQKTNKHRQEALHRTTAAAHYHSRFKRSRKMKKQRKKQTTFTWQLAAVLNLNT